MADWTVPGYTALKVLGSGGFGEVVLARHDATGTMVAIKYLHANLLSDPEFAELFRSEASVLALLDDPNVVRLYEYVESPSGAAIVMELVDGASLREILSHQGQTTPESALVVLQGSLLGLAAAHKRGVVHRDYKPENVLVNGGGASKLTDFGIATRTGARAIPAGTLAYAAPEQMSGGPATPAADVYAATATFYECLTGRPPFLGDTAERVMYQHLFEPVPLDAVPEPLRPLVETGMAKEPERRPTDGTSLVAALRAAAVGAYGPDWEERGRSHLGEAALLLAALWPLGAPPGVQGFGVEKLQLAEKGAKGAKESAQFHHWWHVRHLWHLAHLRHLRRLGARALLAAGAGVALVVAAGLYAANVSFKPSAVNHPIVVHSVSLTPTPAASGSSPAPSLVPTVTGVSPASGVTGGGTLVTITGTHLDGPVTVKFGARLGTITVDLNTKIMVKSPPGKGTVELVVTTPAGSGKAGMFSYHSANAHMPAPAVTGVSPASGVTGGGTLVTITGTGLADATQVSFGGVVGMITADSGTQITVSSPPGNGTVDVDVTTPGGTSTAGMFTYRSPTPSNSPTKPRPAHPAVTGISPSSGPAAGGTAVTISGTNLSDATSVSFGGVKGMITADSGTRITAKSPPGKGTVSVTVTTPGGSAGAGKFNYQAASPPPPARPTVTGVSPASGPTSGGTSVTIDGTNLSGATGVSFGGSGGSITADSGSRITATSPAGSGTVNVTVTTKGGTSATTSADKFTYTTPAPTISLVSPKSGPAGGGTSVTITGQNLSGATSVSFGGSAGSITADNSTVITVTSPAGSGTVNITVTTPGGSVGAGQFTYVVPAPTITGLRPDSGNGCGGTTVQILGTNLSGATSVSFGGAYATINTDSSTDISVNAPSGSGTVNVTVTTAGGTSNAEEFTYSACIQ
ncbi:MAG TPA: IPT/TIG domain-containing protein [Streptosporangiaceae bacterium]|nr:IPT/TIG domain-containing protein [Streptosporangiaceae bacterium]